MMLGAWQWSLQQPHEWLGAVALLLAVLFALGGVLRRLVPRRKGRALLVMLLNMAAASALLALLAPPRAPHPASETVVLLTEGSVGDETMAGSDVVVLPGATAPAGGLGEHLRSVGQVMLRKPGTARLMVYGYGLDDYQWDQVPPGIVVDARLQDVSGLVEPAWPRRLPEGMPLRVGARVLTPGHDGLVEVSLADPAGAIVDRAELRTGEWFELSALPRVTGKLIYQLRAKAGDAVFEEPVALQVTRAPTSRVVVLQSSPSFETRHFKNWAADRGAELSVFTQLTPEHALTESINRETPTGRLDFALLATADLALLEGRALVRLNATQQQWLSEAVDEGLGLLVLADPELQAAVASGRLPLLEGFTLTADEDAAQSVIPAIEGVPDDVVLATSGHLLGGNTTRALFRDLEGRVLSAWRQRGQGRVALSVLRERFRWLTQGQEPTYGRYWSLLMARIGRPQQSPFLPDPNPMRIARVAQRETLCLAGAAETTVAALLVGPKRDAALDVPMARDASVNHRHCGAFWPSAAGWHHIRLAAHRDAPAWDRAAVYVYDDSEWTAASRHARRQSTERRMAATRAADAAPQPSPEPMRPLDPLVPLLVLLLSASALWVERKMDEL